MLRLKRVLGIKLENRMEVGRGRASGSDSGSNLVLSQEG